jgi:uncharacterized protein YqeY
VVVTNDEVEIRYVIPTSPSSEHVRFCHLRKDYFKNAETAEGRATRGDLTDEEVAALLQTEVKRRRDTIAELEKVSRPQMLADEQAELQALLEYVPQQMTREQIVEAARAVISQTGATGPAQMGTVMKQLMAQLKGQADGKLVSEVVHELLAAR